MVRKKPTKTAKAVFEEFKLQSKGYKATLVLERLILILSAVLIMSTPILIRIFPVFELFESINYAYALLIIFIIFRLTYQLLTVPFQIIRELVVFFGLKKKGFDIQRTLSYLWDSHGKKKNRIERYNETVVWRQLFSLYNKAALIWETVIFVLEKLVAFPVTCIASAVFTVLFDNLLRLLLNKLVTDADSIIMLSERAGIVAFLIAAFVSIPFGYMFSIIGMPILKSYKKAIFEQWNAGILNTDPISFSGFATEIAVIEGTHTDTQKASSVRSSSKPEKSRLQAFFPLISLNKGCGGLVLGLFLNLIISAVTSVILLLLSFIPVIGLIFALISFLNGIYWFVSLIVQIINFFTK